MRAQGFWWRWWVVFCFCVGFRTLWSLPRDRYGTFGNVEERFPLAWKHIGSQSWRRGAWYIPPSWIVDANYTGPPPENVLEAATLAKRLATGMLNRDQKGLRGAARLELDKRGRGHFLPNTEIPSIMHQTYKNTAVKTWPRSTLRSAEMWLQESVEPDLSGFGGQGSDQMAYILWTDEDLAELAASYPDKKVQALYKGLPRLVEQLDVARILILDLVGGIYADMDTLPLRSPLTWVDSSDLKAWTPKVVDVSPEVIRFIGGLEADIQSDAPWRWGYIFPQQVTNWAMASAPQYAVTQTYLNGMVADMESFILAHRESGIIRHNKNHTWHEVDDPATAWEEGLKSWPEIPEAMSLDEFSTGLDEPAVQLALGEREPVKFTGPVAVTRAVKHVFESLQDGLEWSMTTGFYDNGQSKAVFDLLILPITGFSPGRSRYYQNMGSKAVSHPDARLVHMATGSWRHTSIQAHLGKVCRGFLGGCRDWSTE